MDWRDRNRRTPPALPPHQIQGRDCFAVVKGVSQRYSFWKFVALITYPALSFTLEVYSQYITFDGIL